MNFKDYLQGTTPNWHPDTELHVLEDIETGQGIKVISPEGKVAYLFIPFAVVAFKPAHKSRWGVEDAQIVDVYPFAQYEDGTFPGEPAITLPLALMRDQKRLSQVALQHYNGPHNMYRVLKNSAPAVADKIMQLSQAAAENWLNNDDVQIHPHDPEYDHN
jgi:hypothetical protein